MKAAAAASSFVLVGLINSPLNACKSDWSYHQSVT